MSLCYLALCLDILNDLFWLKIQQLKFIVAFFNLAIFYLWSFALPNSFYFVFMLSFDLLNLIDVIFQREIDIGRAPSYFTPHSCSVSFIIFSQNHSLLDSVAGQSLCIVIFEGNIHIVVDIFQTLKGCPQVFNGWKVVHSCLSGSDIEGAKSVSHW